MTSTKKLNKITEKIHSWIANDQIPKATDRFLELHPADQAEVFNNLEDQAQAQILDHLDIASTADLFDELEDEAGFADCGVTD